MVQNIHAIVKELGFFGSVGITSFIDSHRLNLPEDVNDMFYQCHLSGNLRTFPSAYSPGKFKEFFSIFFFKYTLIKTLQTRLKGKIQILLGNCCVVKVRYKVHFKNIMNIQKVFF